MHSVAELSLVVKLLMHLVVKLSLDWGWSLHLQQDTKYQNKPNNSVRFGRTTHGAGAFGHGTSSGESLVHIHTEQCSTEDLPRDFEGWGLEWWPRLEFQ